MVKWVSLAHGDLKIFLAYFEQGDNDRAIVIRGTSSLSEYQEKYLSSIGFRKITGDKVSWARHGGIFKMGELRPIFPSIHVVEMDDVETKNIVKGYSPFVLSGEYAKKEHALKDNEKLNKVSPLQVLYTPGSKLGTPIAMIPVNMSTSTYKALNNIVSKYGPIDDFVASSLNMTLPELEKAFSPEQIDAIAVGVAAMMKDREFILADQTGLGKGRVLAGIALAGKILNKKVIFLTESDNLFSDFWRDMKDINADHAFGKPFLLNTDSKIRDIMSPTGEILYNSEKSSELKKIVKEKKFPEGYDIMLATQSQFNRKGSAKSAFFEGAVKDALVIVDETHNSSGDSNIKELFEEALLGAYGVARSSATFVRRASALLSYKRILPPSLRHENVSDMLEAGGNPLAEALSQYLAEDGVLIRREHDVSELSMEVMIDHKNKERNKKYSDALAPILSGMAKLSWLVNDEVETRNEEGKAAGGKAAYDKWYSASFGSRLAPLMRQFITALEVDFCIQNTIDALLNDEKPVIVVESTMESLMRELAKDDGNSSFDENDSADITAEAGQQPPDFKAALSLMLDRILHMSVRRGKNDPEKIKVEDHYILEEAKKIQIMIDHTPSLSLSPIDDIIDSVEAYGQSLFDQGKIKKPWNMNEISARKMRIKNGKYENFNAQDRNSVIVGFNNGDIDGLVITRAASTGLSLHSDQRVKDLRRRCMIELQIASNVVERIQFWGRVNRRGQVNVPFFKTLCTGLPFQMRMMAMENKKLAALSANVSANSDNASNMDVPDIIDSVGNSVAQRLLEDHPDIAKSMCIATKNIDQETADQELYYINKILQRMCFLLSDEQEELFQKLIFEYDIMLNSMKASGKNPRGMRELDGVWVETSRTLYEGGDPKDGEVFGRDVELVTMEGTFEKNPLTSDQVKKSIDKNREFLGDRSGNVMGPYFINEINHLKNNRKKILTGYLSGRYVSVDFALKDKEPNAVKNTNDRINNIMDILTTLQPGLTMTVYSVDDDIRQSAVITSVVPPDNKDEYHLAGRWSVRYAIAGDVNFKDVSLSTLINNKDVYALTHIALNYIPNPSLTDFDNAPRGVVKEIRNFLDGNLVKAVAIAGEVKAGHVVKYKNSNNESVRSILISKNGLKKLRTRSNKIKDVTEGLETLENNRDLFTDFMNKSKGLTIKKDKALYLVNIPNNKDGNLLESFIKHICNFRVNGGEKYCRINENEFTAVKLALEKENIYLYYDKVENSIKKRDFSFGGGFPSKNFSR